MVGQLCQYRVNLNKVFLPIEKRFVLERLMTVSFVTCMYHVPMGEDSIPAVWVIGGGFFFNYNIQV